MQQRQRQAMQKEQHFKKHQVGLPQNHLRQKGVGEEDAILEGDKQICELSRMPISD
jgi:hypothetical protein